MKKTFSLIICFTLFAICNLSAQSGKEEFAIKGFHIDLRTQIMTLPALMDFAKDLSDFGINTIVMEWEASYPFENHATISNKYAYSREQIKEFIDCCRRLNIDVIPLQQCFGHVEYILRHDRYYGLREDRKDPSQLCPIEVERATELFSDLFADLAKSHNSKYFHIGGDETYLLGTCSKCSTKATESGKSKLFVDYMKRMCEIVTSMGKTPVIWADIIIKYPEALAELPKNTIFVDWNYGWKVDHFGDITKLHKAGITFWGAPSIRSHPDNIYLSRWKNHFDNQRDFIPYAREVGYQGMIMTSWSTSGLYSLVYDIGWEPEDMIPIRNLYPLSGSRILVAAYSQSLKETKPIDPEAFVIKYAQSRFGLTQADAKEFCEILFTKQQQIRRGMGEDQTAVKIIRDEFDAVNKRLQKIEAKSNEKEMKHFKLMFDIRLAYLDFKVVEAEYQSEHFSRTMALRLYEQCVALQQCAKELDERFLSLQKGYIPQEEISEINVARSRKLNIMTNTLKNISK